MQAITTVFSGPTNTRGARIITKCDAKRRMIGWDYALGIEENHIAAATALANDLGWLTSEGRPHYRLESGSLPRNGYCHVLVRAE